MWRARVWIPTAMKRLASEAEGAEFVWLSPLEVGFAQKSCSDKFRDGKTIAHLVGNLAARVQRKREVPVIRICRHGDRWYSLDNRRLAAFRIAKMLHPEVCKTVKCHAVVPDPKEWRKKFSTESEGRVVYVSRTDGEVVGDSLATTTYRACHEDAPDVDSDASGEEDLSDNVNVPMRRTTVEWKCRVNKAWHPYPEAVCSWLESQFQQHTLVTDGIGVGVSDTFSLAHGLQYRVHFTAERQFRATDMSCRRAVWRDFQPPQLAALTSPARVEQFLQLPNNGFKRTRAVIDMVVRTLHTLSPSQVYEGGSFKKQTCLAYDFDVDLVLWLNSFDHSRMQSYKEKLKHALAKTFPSVNGLPQVWYTGETPYCLKLRVLMVSIDIVITGDPQSAAAGNPERFFDATKSPLRDKAVIAAKEQYPRLHHLILLAKCWKKRRAWSKTGGPVSYFVELLCMRAAAEAGKHCSLLAAFRRYLQLCEAGNFQVTDYLGRRLEVPNEDQDNFRCFAREALGELGQCS